MLSVCCCMLEGVEGVSCLLETMQQMLRVPEALEGVEGEFCLLEVLEAMLCVLICMLRALFAGGDALCAALNAGVPVRAGCGSGPSGGAPHGQATGFGEGEISTRSQHLVHQPTISINSFTHQ